MIRHKGITHERTEDAPFIGALICAIDCKFNCKGCFNQHLREEEVRKDTIQNIISEIKTNPFNNGIILGGLEWTLQSFELRQLVYESLANDLQVMLYTGLKEDSFKIAFSDIYKTSIYIKYGRYDKQLHSENYHSYGIKLASTNQYITSLKDRI